MIREKQSALKSIPLVVDLDGTLIANDLTWEACWQWMCLHPFRCWWLLIWLLRGKAYLKQQLVKSYIFLSASLPFHQQVLTMITIAKQQQRPLILATASAKAWGQQVADYLGLFDEVLGTENLINLASQQKRDELVRRWGEGGFDYIGNSKADRSVWLAARQAYVVDSMGELSLIQDDRSRYPKPLAWGIRFKILIKAIRVRQWIKNILVFLPLVASHEAISWSLTATTCLVFFCFCACASAVYLSNDLLDLACDRLHQSKKNRPLACGSLTIPTALGLVVGFLGLAFGLGCYALPGIAVMVILAYLLLSSGYSIFFKKKLMLDVVVLAMLYTSRIIAGAYACDIKLTFWMLAFSMSLFLSLALIKRCGELQVVAQDAEQPEIANLPGRSYHSGDYQVLTCLGLSSGCLSILVLALYIQDPTTTALYQHPKVLWLACPLLLYWIGRMWLLSARGHIQDDPLLFAYSDRISWLLFFVLSVIFALAI